MIYVGILKISRGFLVSEQWITLANKYSIPPSMQIYVGILSKELRENSSVLVLSGKFFAGLLLSFPAID